MSNYKQVGDALARGVEPEAICSSCPWDRFCVTPPSMTRGEIEEEAEKARQHDERLAAEAKAKGEPAPIPMGTLLNVVMFSGRDTSAAICPVLAVRLRLPEGRGLVEDLKASMQKLAALAPTTPAER